MQFIYIKGSASIQVQAINYSTDTVKVTTSSGVQWSAQKVVTFLLHAFITMLDSPSLLRVSNEISFHPSLQVLVTVPLSLLQKNTIQFNPPLPDRKLKAIHSLGAGIIEKVMWWLM